MRIIGGKHKGKAIVTPKNLPVRPTTDFAKESLFNILTNQIDFSQVTLLELFAGTGNIGYEFWSRGCSSMTSVDLNFQCVQFIKKTQKVLGMNGKVIRSDSFRFVKSTKETFNFIFADPPYNMPNLSVLPNHIFEHRILKTAGTLVIEHDKHTQFENHIHFKNCRHYGRVRFSFFTFTE
ncbi:MAG: 16S rRNA (guanine(966)-N(2))-methyltransferase RsmD [Bacteroidota bacterium]|nr:16S rRNA (guanine(966)-N(2))-methyltransferase RsmD [Bacteroidota bacterium]